MARKASPEMMQALIACVRSSEANWNEKIRAADIVLTRAWGTEGKIDLDLAGEKVNSITIVIERGGQQPEALHESPQQLEPPLIIDTVRVGGGDN